MIIDDFRKEGNVPSSKLLLIIIARGFAISWLIPLINSIFLRFFFRSDRVCVKSSADIGFNENEDKGVFVFLSSSSMLKPVLEMFSVRFVAKFGSSVV